MEICYDGSFAPDFPPQCVTVVLAKLATGRKPEALGVDRFPVFADDPLRAAHLLLNDYLAELPARAATIAEATKFRLLPQVDNILLFHAAMDRAVWLWGQIAGKHGSAEARRFLRSLENLLKYLLTRGLPFLDNDFVRILGILTGPGHHLLRDLIPLQSLMDMVERHLERASLSYDLRAGLTALRRQWIGELELDNDPDVFVRLCALVSDVEDIKGFVCRVLNVTTSATELAGTFGAVEQHVRSHGCPRELEELLRAWLSTLEATKLPRNLQPYRGKLRALLDGSKLDEIEPGEAWSDAARSELSACSKTRRQHWHALIGHCLSVETSKPTKKWLRTAQELVGQVEEEDFKERVLRWFPLVALPRPVHREPIQPRWQPSPDLLITERNATILRGLAWCCAGLKDEKISRALSDLAEVCFKKVRWLGPRCPRVGNACLFSLSSTATEAAAAQLSKLDQLVKQPTARKRINQSLNQAAELTGQTRADLEEKSVPTFGLGADGKLSRAFGRHTSELRVLDSREVKLIWLSPDGKPLNAVPAEVKRDHAADLKSWQKLSKDIGKMLSAQRIRLERMLIMEREWDFEAWRQRYLEHPLLAPIARRLLWHFRLQEKTSPGAWLQGQLVDLDCRPLDWLAPETRVRLWHPLGFPVETVAAWRRWLEDNRVCQPFKQAHREIYILTDAELETATYSNRFAAHIISQHQFVALCRQRGWKYSFMGGFDFQSTPTLALPAWNLTAEFWVEPTHEQAATGVSAYLATDQVRFLRNGEPVELSEVPAPVFSEVMRDVDLFVGVCSIGNDPAWRDHGELEDGGNYWTRYSFGELAAPAKARRDVLERLLPKLRIAGACVLQERFLVVKGTRRTYKIHLGSANILMEPNDQYLCVVPERGSARVRHADVFLPFEGDNTLSIILSKAFMLADDAKISDPTILRQICGESGQP
ncbi:MAG: hypothetical protein C5B50_15790 [Verrucomicrobia bacterium]|nr:MAG: hypothetical protein C5B50_15790 [Verrucomicrobiota bacterium]